MLIVDFLIGALIFIITMIELMWSMMVIIKKVSSGAMGVRWVGWLGEMDNNTTTTLSPSPFLVMYK